MQNSTDSVTMNAEAFNTGLGVLASPQAKQNYHVGKHFKAQAVGTHTKKCCIQCLSYFKHSSHFCESLPIAYISNSQLLQI